LELGYSVKVLENFEAGKYRHLPFSENLPYRFMQGNIGNYEDCKIALQDVDIVFDLAMPMMPSLYSEPVLKDYGEYLRTADDHWGIFLEIYFRIV
jgi:hypothetical protein